MADAAEEIVGNLFPTPEPSPAEAQAPQVAPVVERPAEAPIIEPAPVVAPVEAPVSEAAPQGGQIPIQALLDEREKRQKFEREATELRQWRQQQESQRQAPARPDLYDDPEGFAAYQEQRLAQTQQAVTEQISERFATTAHGAETVEAAKQWAMARRNSDPLIGVQFLRQPDPFGWLVQEYQRDRLLTEIGNDPDAYVRRRYAELGDGSGNPPGAPVLGAPIPQSPPAPPPPRSQAGLPSAGGGHQSVPVHSMAALDGLFPKG